MPGLYIGEVSERRNDPAEHPEIVDQLSVHEWLPRQDGGHIPVYDRDRGRAITQNLNRAAEWIDARMKVGKPVLVYCGQGIERSPLAVAWYLWKSGRAASLTAAYDVVRQGRPQAQDRSSWVTWELQT